MVQMKTMDNLTAFQNSIDGWLWRALWVSIDNDIDMAEHMWNKFHGYNHQILDSWAYADLKNRRVILAMINKWADMRKRKVNMMAFVREMNSQIPRVMRQ